MLRIYSSQRYALRGPLVDPETTQQFHKLPRMVADAQNAVNAHDIDDLISKLEEISQFTSWLATEYRLFKKQ